MARATPTKRRQRAAYPTLNGVPISMARAAPTRRRQRALPLPLVGLLSAMAFAAPTAATDKSHVDAPDLDAQRLWTPEPEPSDSDGDTYTAWGRKHLGEDWYQQRSIMLKECDVYVPVDSGVWAPRPNRWVSNDVPPQVCYEDNDKEEMNLKFFQWNYQGFSREEQEQLGRMHGFPGRPLFPLQKDRIHCFRNFEELSEPTRPRPKPEKEMDRFLFLWKLFLSDKELAELARLYGFDTDKRPDGVLVSRALPSPLPKTASARGRRATENAPQSPSTRAAPASEGPPPDRGRPGRASRQRTAQPEPVPGVPPATKTRAAPAPAPRKNPRSRNAKPAPKPDTLHRRLSPDRVTKKPSRPRTAASVQHPVVSRSGRSSKAPERLGFPSCGD